MQPIRVNRNLVKVVHSQKQGLESYRFYCMARHAFSHRSGIFSLEEFCDLLFSVYGYSSLHKKAGNKRKKYKLKFDELFSNSILFRPASDGRFIAISDRKVLLKFRTYDKSSWYELPDINILASKGKFNDFCIGILLAGNKFRSNSKVAKYCNCSKRRVQQATAANHKNTYFRKQYNFIHDYTGSAKTIKRLRGELFLIHGISSPHPIKYKGQWMLRLNAPNTYKTFVLCGVKGHITQPTKEAPRREVCWFKPVKPFNSERKNNKRRISKKLSVYGDEPQKWVFNESVFNLDSYVHRNSSLLN